MIARHYARCSDPDCRRRIMLPRWAKIALLNDPGAEWYCLDCSGETPRDRIEWAEDCSEVNDLTQNQDGQDGQLEDPADPERYAGQHAGIYGH